MKLLRQIEPEKSTMKITSMAKIGAVLFIAVFVLEVWLVNRLATYGDKIQELKQAQASLELENQVLENSIAEKMSLTSVEREAGELGFSSIKDIEFVKQTGLASAAQTQ